MTATKKKPPNWKEWLAAHGGDKKAATAAWKDAWAKIKADKKALGALGKTSGKKSTDYQSALAALDVEKQAVYHKPSKKGGFFSSVGHAIGGAGKTFSTIMVPVLPGKHGLQLTGGAKDLLGKKLSSTVDTALEIGGGVALGGAAADIGSNVLGSSGGASGVAPMDETTGLDDIFGFLNKAGQYAQQGRATLENLGAAFGGGSSAAQAPSAPPVAAGSTWSKYGLWIVAGLGLLVVLVLVMKKR